MKGFLDAHKASLGKLASTPIIEEWYTGMLGFVQYNKGSSKT